MRMTLCTLGVAAVAALAGCSSKPHMTPMSGPAPMGGMAPYSQAALPDAMRVPAGQRVAMETVGVGRITYECRASQANPAMQEWVFVGPEAVLNDRSGRRVGRYYGPPATWEANDGSKLTANQLAVSPGGTGNIPLQLVQGNPAMGSGAMMGVTYIQRVNTRGGVAPAEPCNAAMMGQKRVVDYQADYIFYKAGM